jgi:hypothetical protein
MLVKKVYLLTQVLIKVAKAVSVMSSTKMIYMLKHFHVEYFMFRLTIWIIIIFHHGVQD